MPCLHCVYGWMFGLTLAMATAWLNIHLTALVSVNMLAAPGASRGDLLSFPPLADRQTGSGC